MTIKKIIALLLCIILLSITISGCNSSDNDLPDDNGDIYNEDDGTPGIPDNDHSHGFINFEAALSTFPADTVMLRSGDFIITWAELYYFLFNVTTSLLYSYGGPLEWSEPFDLNQTLAEIVLEYSTEEALAFLSYRYGLHSNNFQMSDDDLKDFNSDIEELIAMSESREAFEESLREGGGFYNFDLFFELNKINMSVGLLISDLFGEDADLLPDEDVESFAEENGFMMAMHILIKLEDGDFDDPLGEAENILAELNAQAGTDDFAEFFHELMHEVSEDLGGLMSYPDGYLFVHKDMVLEFSDTTAGLEIGELSGIVETSYGYHIILRIPLDYEAVPFELYREGIYRSLRQLAALDSIYSMLDSWRDSLDVSFSPEYNSIDLASIFKWVDEDCDH